MLVVVVLWPGVWLGMGFQLTFSALAGILLSLWWLSSYNFESSLLSKVFNTFAVSVGAWIGTAPVVYFWTGYFSFLPPIANFLVTPLFSFCCIALGCVSLILYYLNLPGSGWLLGIGLYLTEVLLWIIKGLDQVVSRLF